MDRRTIGRNGSGDACSFLCPIGDLYADTQNSLPYICTSEVVMSKGDLGKSRGIQYASILATHKLSDPLDMSVYIQRPFCGLT